MFLPKTQHPPAPFSNHYPTTPLTRRIDCLFGISNRRPNFFFFSCSHMDLSIDGTLGTSQPSSSGSILFPYSSLSMGTHLISLEVSDPEGMTCVEQILLLIDLLQVLLGPLQAQMRFCQKVLHSRGKFNNFLMIRSSTRPRCIVVFQFGWCLSSQGSDTWTDFALFLSLLEHIYYPIRHGHRWNALHASANGCIQRPSRCSVCSITPSTPSSSDNLLANASGSIDPKEALSPINTNGKKMDSTTHTSNIVPSSDTTREIVDSYRHPK